MLPAKHLQQFVFCVSLLQMSPVNVFSCTWKKRLNIMETWLVCVVKFLKLKFKVLKYCFKFFVRTRKALLLFVLLWQIQTAFPTLFSMQNCYNFVFICFWNESFILRLLLMFPEKFMDPSSVVLFSVAFWNPFTQWVYSRLKLRSQTIQLNEPQL